MTEEQGIKSMLQEIRDNQKQIEEKIEGKKFKLPWKARVGKAK